MHRALVPWFYVIILINHNWVSICGDKKNAPPNMFVLDPVPDLKLPEGIEFVMGEFGP
jgi:hypothetical protein